MEAEDSGGNSSDHGEEGAEEERPISQDWVVEPVKLHDRFLPEVSAAEGPAKVPQKAPSPAAGPAEALETSRHEMLADVFATDDEKDHEGSKAVHKVGQL